MENSPPLVNDVLLIRASEADHDYLYWLRMQTMVEHLQRDGLFYTEAQHWQRMLQAYECAHIVWVNRQKVGLLKYKIDDGQLHIIQFQLDPAQQGKGLGQLILRYLFARHAGLSVSLTVLKHNPAMRLYQRLGFSVVGQDDYEFHMHKK